MDNLIERLGEKKLFIFDFRGSVIPEENIKESELGLADYLFSEGNLSLEMAAALKTSRSKRRRLKDKIRFLAGMCENIDEGKIRKIGEDLKQYVRRPIEVIIAKYPHIPKAMVSADEYRIVNPTARKLGIKTIIANRLNSKNGKITNRLKSYSSGVKDWKGGVIDTAEKKYRAVMAVVRTYRVRRKDVVYFSDDEIYESKIKRAVRSAGGIVIDNY